MEKKVLLAVVMVLLVMSMMPVGIAVAKKEEANRVVLLSANFEFVGWWDKKRKSWGPAEFRNVKITPIKKVPTAEYKIQVTQAGVTHTVKPIERAKSAKVFYNFRSDSAHTPFVENNVSKLYMYRDSTRGKLSLIVHHGKDNQPGGWFRVDFDFSGIPADAFVAVSDDLYHKWSGSTHPEGQELDLRYEPEGNWSTMYNTDGGVLSGLPIDKQWSIKIKPNFIKGTTAITAWWYQTPKGVENIRLHMNKPVTISLVPKLKR